MGASVGIAVDHACPVVGELSAVLIGVGFLHVFFRAVESQWPTSYFALTSGPDYAITRSLGRYLTFRLLPVLVVAVFAAVTLGRAGDAVVIPVAFIGAIHAGTTSGRALLGLVRSGRAPRRPLLTLMHPAVMVGVTCIAVAGALVAPWFDGAVPSVDDVTSDLWTGLIAGVVGAYAVRVSQPGHVSSDIVFAESRKSIPDDLWRAAADSAARWNADADLVRAVMLAENVQRPGWFRRLERLGARLFRQPATLGILQAGGRADDGDTELLDQAVQNLFSGVTVKTKDGYIDWDALDDFAARYNSDPNYAELLATAMTEAQR